jgi:F0F1-type ATP synthase delta subunit
MKKNVLKKLAIASYTENELDEKKVSRISKSLNRADLKDYINDLKNIENKRTVTVTIPNEEESSKIKQMFAKIYPNKRIVVKIDEELITGIKVVDYDNVYELSLKGYLENSLDYLKQND